MKRISRHPAATAWYIFGGLVALGVGFLVARELPSMRRELHLMKM